MQFKFDDNLDELIKLTYSNHGVHMIDMDRSLNIKSLIKNIINVFNTSTFLIDNNYKFESNNYSLDFFNVSDIMNITIKYLNTTCDFIICSMDIFDYTMLKELTKISTTNNITVIVFSKNIIYDIYYFSSVCSYVDYDIKNNAKCIRFIKNKHMHRNAWALPYMYFTNNFKNSYISSNKIEISDYIFHNNMKIFL